MKTLLPFYILLMLVATGPACAQDANAAQDPPKIGRFPHIEVDVSAKTVRVECEALNVEMALEFFCVVTGTSDHESVLRSPVRPRDLHTALLMLNLEPGEPVRYSESTQKFLPPHGAPIQIFCEYEKDGKKLVTPAYRWMRNIRTKQTMPPITWVFTGSRVMPDGTYAADRLGYLVNIVNFDMSMIDVPKLVSNSNETLEWEFNPEIVPAPGTKVWMIFKPAGEGDVAGGATMAAEAQGQDANPDIDALREKWKAAVVPHDQALRDAAQAHYDVINDLRSQQQKLIDEADKIQRLIDELESQYQSMTTPRPPPVTPSETPVGP